MQVLVGESELHRFECLVELGEAGSTEQGDDLWPVQRPGQDHLAGCRTELVSDSTEFLETHVRDAWV